MNNGAVDPVGEFGLRLARFENLFLFFCHSPEALVAMERSILRALKFKLGMPTCLKFLDYYWQKVTYLLVN